MHPHLLDTSVAPKREGLECSSAAWDAFFLPSEWLCGVVIVIVTRAVIHKVVDHKLVLF